ncbi:MAG: ABC transporter substrate-binding protein [Thermoguttaceae bacterium]|nr:ABC transporter substrate-binding protein [Thermoguttaceae bacterium]MDW8079005.1 ABC transporter substrate-binding protein [Thermoguttaceae bacterium]
MGLLSAQFGQGFGHQDLPASKRQLTFCALLAVAAALLVSPWGNVYSQEPLPLYEQEAYDQITLTPDAGGKVLKVLPLPFPNRRVPQPLPRTGNLQFRLVDEPDVLYEIPWAAIAQIDLFHDLVLAKARELVSEGKFEEAFDYFDYLHENDPQLPGLQQAYNDFLFREATWHQAEGRHDRALALLSTLYRRQADYPGLSDALGQSVDHLFRKYVDSENYSAARQLVRTLEGLFPRHPVADKGRQELIRMATAQLEEARRHDDEGRFSLAHRSVRQALGIWPALAEATQLASELQAKYPRVVVAVSEPFPVNEPEPFSDWASRRITRLVARRLLEFAGPSLEGGRYACPVGEVQWDRNTLRLTLRLRPGIKVGPMQEELTAPRIVSELYRSAVPQPGTGAKAEWARLIKQASCIDLYTAEFELAQAFLRPEALLTLPIELTPLTVVAQGETPLALAEGLIPHQGGNADGSNGSREALPPWTKRVWLGPYRLTDLANKEAVFAQERSYFGSADNQPREIVEVHYPSAIAAFRAFQAGEVDLVDRIPPWMIADYSALPGVLVEPYALPLVHCLIPNTAKPLLRRSIFRRALLYGLDRQAILSRLMGTLKSDACRVISGPFPATSGHSDPLDYAYDSGIEPKPYDPQLAMALAQVAFTEWQAELPEKDRPTRIPPLTLGYVPGPIAQQACEAIAESWRRLGFTVRLQPIETTPVREMPADVDLLYAELAVWEPLVDAERLFGPNGLVQFPSPHLAQAVYRLNLLRDWNEAAAQLRRIHRLADLQTPIVPLWQLVDYFAYPVGFEGIGKRPITLYQNVEKWRPVFRPIQLE